MKNAYDSRRLIASLAVGSAIAVSLGLAPTPVIVRDRFTDNNINPQLWLTHQFGVVNATETNQRFEFNAPVTSGDDSYAGLEVKNWGANWKHDFELEIDFKLNLTNVVADREVLIGVGLVLEGSFPEDPTGIIAAVVRDSDGLTLVIARGEAGEIVASAIDEIALTATQGQLTVEWDRSDGRMTARVGNKEVALNGIWSALGATYGNDPMVIALGCFAFDGNRTFPGSRVYIDDFKFEGVKKSRL